MVFFLDGLVLPKISSINVQVLGVSAVLGKLLFIVLAFN